MAGAWQLRLLLWKDYLIRKRKPITLAGVAWATLVVLSLYAVRINIDNKDYSTCQFAARALPSAGVLNFLQSFVCNVNNECSPMDQFEEIPAYSKSTFTQLQRQLSPLIDNETVVDVVSSAPDALKLLATLADVADNQMLVKVLKNGLKVADLFRNPKRVKRYLTQALDIPEEVANSIITADIGFDGIVQGKLDRCNVNSLKKVFKVENVDHLTLFANKLCELDNQMVQNLVMELLLQIDFGKYITMAGDMYSKLDGDNRITKIGNMLEAVLKMTTLHNFLPLELVGIIKGQKPEFSYVNMTIITKIIDLFQPTFGETESYKSIKEFADTLVLGLRYLHNILVKKTEDGDVTDLALKDIGKMDTNSGFKRVSQIFSNIANSVTELGDSSKSIKIFDILSGLTNFIFKWLPENTKSDILFYTTLLGKLIEGADKVVNINMHVEQLAYNVSLRNPKGVKVLSGLTPDVIEKGLEALVDAERTQILTSKINDPGQIFCDTNRLKNFFLISREEATNLKTQLCTDAWDNYIKDLISSFGIYDVKNNINSMASLFILSTLGQDISDQLYSVDKDFEIVKDFTEHIKEIELEEKPVIDWKPIFNKADSDVLKIFRKKAYLGKHMLITVHGALAKEVVTQNPLLEYKIAPILKKIIVMINAMNEQLDVAPKDLQIKAKELYPEIVLTILNTAMDEGKSYKALSTSCQDMLCHGLKEASKYLNFPENINQDYLVTTMCNVTKAIDEGLEKESIIGKAIAQIKNASYSPLEGINWTKLITDLNNLYEKLNNDYTYLFEYKTFGMDENMQKKVTMMTKEVKEFWFNVQNLSRGLHVSIKLGLRVLDLLDRGIFNIQDESWIKLKFSLASTTGPVLVVDDLIQLIAGIATNTSYTSNVPIKTALTLQNILPNLPPLIIEVVDLVKRDNTDINPIISILNSEKPWPCSSTSLTEILQLSDVSQTAVKSLETLMCFNEEMRTEWRRYLDERNVTMFNTKTWNTTTYPENIFLRFSSAFDSILKDFDSINEIIQIAFDEDLEGGQVTFMSSLRYMVDVFNGTDGDIILRSFFNKLDSVLNSINTTNFDTISLHILWKEYLNCSGDCQMIGRATWKYTLEFLSVVGGNVTEDLFVYFKESNEPNTTLIQLLGFTRNTGLYMLYDKLPDFISALINSYFDLGFLNQIRRASLTHFWDCDEVLSSLNPGPFSPIDMAAIKHVQPIICPSFLYWISMPRGDNRLIDLFTKPQYQFFTLEAGNLSSTYEKAYANANDLTNILNDISKKNITKPFNFDLNILKEKLESAIDSVISYRIKDTDRHYRSFSEANKKYSTSSVYLTRVVIIINKLVTELDNLNITEVVSDSENVKNLESELSILQKIFKRRPSEAIAFHFDLITDVLANKNKDYKMTNALEDICARSKTKDNLKDILAESDRVKIQICAKKYDIFYKALQHVLDDDSIDARKSLENLVKIYKEENDNVTDTFTFLKESKKIVEALRTSIKYSYDLGIPIYLKYLQNNLKHYGVILSFLSGDNWWEELRGIYNGPKAKNFFYTVEKGFDIAEDVLTHLDKIHLIRLLRDVNINSTDAFCQANVTLADYVPDSTGLLSAMHRQMCDTDTTELFKELPPLLFASQGYDNNLKMSDEVDYISLYSDISNTESKLEIVKDGSQPPLRPLWVTEENLKMLKDVAMQLLSKESLIKISFGVVSNVVDAGTLFINNSQCTLCSQFTSWFKQLNLQLYKKQEYDNFLCSLDSASPHSFSTLNNDFHWDMAISELISTRNYTKYELNKSLNELLEQIKLHLLEDMSAKSTKLVDCLASNLTGNTFGHAALFVKVAARTTKLLRSYLPYLQEVPGITDLPYLNQLKANIAHNFNVKDKLYKYLINYEQMSKHLVKVIKDKKLIDRIENAEVDLVQLKDLKPTDAVILIQDYPWEEICKKYDCKEIIATINKHVNVTLVDLNLPKLQAKEFWQFSFLSKILIHVEATVDHIGRMLGIVSKVDLEGVKEGKLAAILDTGLQILMDDTMESILYSVLGLVKELHPILNGTALEFDITAVTDGLMIIRQFKNYIVDEDFKVNVSQIFSNPEIMELSLNNLGINNTNFWSIAAPRIRAGYITIKPLLTQKQGTYHISDFVCETDNMSKVIIPGNVDVVTLEDIYGAVSEQFCGMDDEQARSIIPILVENLNFEMIIDKLKSFLLTKVFAASNLTQTEGDTVLSQFSTMAALIPELQGSFINISEKLSNEPLLKRMRKSLSVGDMLASSDFLTDAGNMLCGKPFYTDISRLYKAVAQNADLTSKPDRAQLEALPTDFCRSLYKDIISMEGGKIVWSFIKPLIVGKILYTPATPAVQKIIEQANSTFVPMGKVVNIIHSFANSFSSVDKLTQHKDGLAALQNLITSPQYSEIRKSLIGEIQAGNFDIDGVFDSFGDTQAIGGIVKKASDLLHCINLDRFKPASNEHDLTLEAARLAMINEFSAGLVFLNMSDSESKIASKIKYKIRMDIDNAPTTRRIKNYLWTPGPESSFLENMRYFRGFVQLQDIVDKAIIELSMENSSRIQKREIKGANEMDWAVYTQEEPYPCYRKDFFQTSLYESQSLIVAFFFSLLFTVSSAVRFIVSDKETGNTMLMSVMGVNLSYHTLSWFVWSLVELVVTVACITVVLCCGRVLPRSDPSLIFVMLLIFGFSVLAFCYMMSTLFRSASSAAVCTGIAYLITFMPFVLILSLEAVLSSHLKIFVSLSMSSSLCYGFLFITRFEAMGIGAGWSQIWEAPDNTSDMNIAIAAVMVFVDGVVYLIIGYIINRFYGIKSESNITNCHTTGEKAGVSIINVTKIYDEGSRRAKLALDNVSMELQKGQITTLLGHNGAGKTTLIKILTGMLKPTKGHVIVRSDDVNGTGLGVCPQKDVLFEYMTAREHIALYAQLKSGLSLEEVQDEVDSMLRVLCLGPISDTVVARLSGGTRRRLCVALAFVARPRLVSLDEPTAGVDPAARRDIWSMIMKLRENRTILLTTHHLDEAELLSDQIVIMHKGQIHTTGTPIEIKRTLGTGYKLTVVYPDKRLHHLEYTENEEVSIEEKTKNLLAVARSVVKNANVVDVSGLEVEINLPFFDTDGVSNNFMELCSALEQQRDALAYRSMSLDCSSLEQVFYTVCQQLDGEISSIPESTSKSASTSSIKNDNVPLVSPEGVLKGSAWQQFVALLYARYLHYLRNRWLLFLLIVLPSLFITVAMGFSTIRPPADAEVSLQLYPEMYEEATQYLIPTPTTYSNNIDSIFAQRILDKLRYDNDNRNWTSEDSPNCRCVDAIQQCDIDHEHEWNRPQMMVLPDVDTLNDWIIDSHDVYIEKRYGGYSAVLQNNVTHLVAWYNNKGHHALPAFLNALNTAILRVVSGNSDAGIEVYTHPLKISKEILNKDSVYQHIADAGISGMLLIAYALASAGGAVYLVTSRRSQEKRLQLLCGVTPLLYCTTALLWDMAIIMINLVITAIVLEIFHFPVFVARNNLPAICILILLYGYGCANLVHVAEKAFTEASLANMLLFCGNAFIGLSGITLLLILDVISDSDETDHARWVLHKILLLSPQFALGDGLLEIAKNTIQAEVLSQFGMDTYRDPLRENVVGYHYIALILVGTLLFVINLAIEYDCFEVILARFRSKSKAIDLEVEPTEVSAEETRVRASLQPLRLRTIGNINAGFIDSENIIIKNGSLKRSTSVVEDICACVRLRKVYGARCALHGLTLGIPPGQCTALLGENGAGKSTTFSMLTGQLRPTSGQIYLHGRKVTARDLCEGLISYCPQSDALDPLMTVRETLVLYCRLRGIDDRDEVIRRTIEAFELTKYRDVRTGALSGGNKRKLCAAVAFMGRAPLVLLDEPTSGMDPLSRACVSRCVRSAVHAHRGALLATHALEDARRLAARVALLKEGRLVALAPLDECLRRFGGGYIVACRVRRGSARAVWTRIHARAPHASLRVLHHAALHFLLPTHATVEGKEIITNLSDIFRLLAEMQMSCDIEDYTVNQSSLDQMFLNFTERTSILDPADEHPTPRLTRRYSEELDSVTSL